MIRNVVNFRNYRKFTSNVFSKTKVFIDDWSNSQTAESTWSRESQTHNERLTQI